jgi:hypothetical protein
MFSFIQKLFKAPTANRARSVSDSVLGELRLSDDADWWEGSVEVDGKRVGFNIGGKGKPDAKLIAHAHDIVSTLPEFEQMVSAFLADETRTDKQLARFADEIRQLTIEDVCLLRPDRPDDGMIYFKGPDEFRVWRCDYVGRKPRGLGFDS